MKKCKMTPCPEPCYPSSGFCKKHRRQYRKAKKYGVEISALMNAEDKLERGEIECQICGNDFKNRKDMNIDHDHRTEKVRGLLCMKCNTSLGWLEKHDAYLEKTIEYIKRGLK